MKKTKKTIFTIKPPGYSPLKEKLEADLKDLFSIIEDAYFSYEIWWILVSKESRDKYFAKMLQYKDFFQPTAFAHINSFIVNLYKLFETRRDTLNFPRLIKEAKSLNIFNPAQIEFELKEAKNIWIKIGILRNKLFAHKNYQLDRKTIYNEAQINPNNIKYLIELNLIIFNALWISLGKTKKNIDEFSTRDTNKLFADLSKINTQQRNTADFSPPPSASGKSR